MIRPTGPESPAHLRSTTLESIEAAKDAAAKLAAALAGAAAGWARADTERLRTYLDGSDLPIAVRRPVPLGLILVGSVAVGVAVYLVLRKPPDVRPRVRGHR